MSDTRPLNPLKPTRDNAPALSGASRTTGSGNEPRLGGRAAVPALLAALRSSDHNARMAAGRGLKSLKDPAAVHMLLAALDDEHTQVRSVAAAALGAIGAQHGESTYDAVLVQGVPALQRSLRDRQIPVRMWSARALGQIGEPGPVLDLIDALKDASPHVRGAAAGALGLIGMQHAEAGARSLEALLAALHDIDSAVRTLTAEALGRVAGAQPHPAQRVLAVPGLLDAFRDDSVQVRSEAAKALAVIGPDAVAGLIRALKHDEMQVRSAAAWVLEQIGEQHSGAAIRAIDALITALDDEDEQVRWYAVGALGVLRDARAVPRLVRMLNDTDQPYAEPYNVKRICDLAAEALERIGTPEARAAIRIWRVGRQ